MRVKRPHRFLSILGLAAMSSLLATGCGKEYPVLSPAGPAGKTELDLIILSTVLVAIVVIPVLILLAIIVWRYRDKPGRTAPYSPEWVDSKKLEYTWWAIPVVIVAILGIITARTTFTLTQPPETSVKPITIQVISLNWKWLFEYPDQKVATVNYVNIPTGVPVQFELTSDAPMNSFWVPQLGGQEYTMPGMAMRLWLQADKNGDYKGYGANFTGKDFAHMQFNVHAQSMADFNAWVQQVKSSAPALTKDGYTALREPGVSTPTAYSSFPTGLFNDVVMANGGGYMAHNKMILGNQTNNMSGMDMSGTNSSDSNSTH